MKIKILIPIYNDWQSVNKLLENINDVVLSLPHKFSVIIVNDASTEKRPEISLKLDSLKSIKIINIKKNQGHTRCIATGLKYIYEKEDFDYVIPMDGDGEDRPEEIKEFLNWLPMNSGFVEKAIVGERVKRSENLFFKICYQIHKLMTLFFTGKSIKYGNFTCLPKSTVQRMVKEKGTWNSFSGSLYKTEKGDLLSVPSKRGNRYFGPSKMSFKSLIFHSLSIISVFKITVLIRSILFLLVYIFLIYQKISIIMFIPALPVLALIFAVFIISERENLSELSNCLTNINDIQNLK